MATIYEIPLSARPQTFSITLFSGVYSLRFTYCDTAEGGWIMDINDGTSGDPIACGLPLVTGGDMLSQFAYLGFTEELFVLTDGDPDAVPTFANLGTTSHLYVQG